MGMEEDPKKEAEEKFSFLQETIKKEPVSGAGIRKKVLRIAALGLVFGMFACIGFYVLEPWAARTFQEKADKVTIPEDEENPEGKEAAEEEETKAAVLSAENYDELVGSVYEIGREAERCVVSVDAAAAAMTPDQSCLLYTSRCV